MGVSGCGKSSVASNLADHYGFHYIEADDFHSEQAKQHMAAGLALTDAMRLPWIKKLKQQLQTTSKSDNSAVLAFSGLRQAHRMQFRDIFDRTVFIHLVAPYDTILQRMNQRNDHFMPVKLLASQFAALEPVSGESDIIEVDANIELISLIQDVSKKIDLHLN